MSDEEWSEALKGAKLRDGVPCEPNVLCQRCYKSLDVMVVDVPSFPCAYDLCKSCRVRFGVIW